MTTEATKQAGGGKFLRYAIIGCFVLFIAVAVIFYRQVDPKAFHNWAAGLSGWWVLVLLALLPLIGFPISVLFIVVGAKFGSGWGMLVVSLTTAIHLLVTYWLTTSFLHNPIASLFKRTKYRMPKVRAGDHVSVTLLTALVPGVPYAAKNYLLVLAGVPLRPFFWICLPAHIFHASLAIFFGDLTRDLSAVRIAFLVGYAAVIVLLGRHVLKRLRAREDKETGEA